MRHLDRTSEAPSRTACPPAACEGRIGGGRATFKGAQWGVTRGQMKPAVLVVVVSASLLGCGGDGSPTGPSGGSGVPLVLSVPGFGMTISLSVGGQTISAAGTHEIRLAAGSQTITGSSIPNGLASRGPSIGFFRHPTAGGGVRSGSLRSLTGPVLETNPCSITYSTLPGSTEPQ